MKHILLKSQTIVEYSQVLSLRMIVFGDNKQKIVPVWGGVMILASWDPFGVWTLCRKATVQNGRSAEMENVPNVLSRVTEWHAWGLLDPKIWGGRRNRKKSDS